MQISSLIFESEARGAAANSSPRVAFIQLCSFRLKLEKIVDVNANIFRIFPVLGIVQSFVLRRCLLIKKKSTLANKWIKPELYNHLK